MDDKYGNAMMQLEESFGENWVVTCFLFTDGVQWLRLYRTQWLGPFHCLIGVAERR